MSIQFKALLPMAIIVLLLGGVSYFLIDHQLNDLKLHTIDQSISAKAAEVYHAIDQSTTAALNLASLFSRAPRVVEAFTLAQQGNINDESSPQAQQAREFLRKELAPDVQGYAEVNGGDKLQLHFHLPNGRSLVRMWRDKQTKRDGKWLDISDDISSFRQTVLDVNQTGQPIRGIELGRGGFAIRGLAPVKSPEGKQLGSVEVLKDFNPILERLSRGDSHSLVLYMNKEFLDITRSLQDPSKYPVLADRYVRLTGDEDNIIVKTVTPELLERGSEGLAQEERGELALAAFPVKDYRDRQIGVIVYALDITSETALIRTVGYILGAILLAILIIAALTSFLLLQRIVIRPVKNIVNKIKDIAEDRADLSELMEIRQRDEIGDLAIWFNKLMGKISEILGNAEQYMNMVNAVPFPIFAVNDDDRFLVANKATEKMFNLTHDQLMERKCHEVFKTSVCQSENCPIFCAKKKQSMHKGDTVTITDKKGETRYVQPLSDVLRNRDGEVLGYVEVAMDITDKVEKDRQIQAHLKHMETVNRHTLHVANEINAAANDVDKRLEAMLKGAAIQRDRANETATAMEQMTASVLEVARNAGEAAEQSEQTRERANEGARVVGKAVESIGQVQSLALAVKENMADLGQRADNIGRIMNVITDIADQTNLLALNAAIEAARAGDAGRGFAVVADEVRKLAEKTMNATKEVGEAIQAIQDGAKTNAKVVDKAAKAVEEATVLANQSGQALGEIVNLVNQSNDQVRAIATAAEEQSAASEQINKAMEEVNAIAQETSESMDASLQSMRDLSELAQQLREMSE